MFRQSNLRFGHQLAVISGFANKMWMKLTRSGFAPNMTDKIGHSFEYPNRIKYQGHSHTFACVIVVSMVTVLKVIHGH